MDIPDQLFSTTHSIALTEFLSVIDNPNPLMLEKRPHPPYRQSIRRLAGSAFNTVKKATASNFDFID